jgi:hypothetical protein
MSYIGFTIVASCKSDFILSFQFAKGSFITITATKGLLEFSICQGFFHYHHYNKRCPWVFNLPTILSLPLLQQKVSLSFQFATDSFITITTTKGVPKFSICHRFFHYHHCNKRCPCAPNDFTGFWSEFNGLVNKD